jgi:hypothetical protein
MKYLLCGYCGDVFNLVPHYKECSCGRTAGAYITSEKAVYSGDHAICLAIHNKWYEYAVQHRAEGFHFGDKTFIGWFVPDGGKANFTKVDNVYDYLNSKLISEYWGTVAQRVSAWIAYDQSNKESED